ncbi:sigma-54-dependent Fis family transcriptional regulator [Luteibacter rhizovicinus DSM 16549]|uniref:Sigma-54-dependent Fis family transcriptional regulator n=1 Tax=Luteibacter rhizovicinus DSM 16549 TaxID=1440763 RepID=A0A0G9HGB9_9GAMM|nr:sigma-54 dependent transcriptional regulator [Luteibacter rhizovicinus]APG03595.1 sigma-54-dependent Fis family transcriptional regulator [Luteibacter rhizovicinus DSM 16549]KLD68758.1 chemotaxis protein CheY [Luteibacter rhizovicinus DSM 16549]KLD76414.1 chemotaxis protein CheY [Xanthomonas hyacinthi DSM 19077]
MIPRPLLALPVLIVDDQADVLVSLRLLFRSLDIPSVQVTSPEAALDAASRADFACALLDLNYSADTTSGHEGLELIGQLREDFPELPLVAMTAWGSVDLAVQAMRRGAADFIEKPWNNERMLHTVRSQIALREIREENRRLRAENALGREIPDVLRAWESSAMREVTKLASRIAASDANVLILGENGTGKSLLAREIHTMSSRADGPVIRVDMGSLPESRFVDEMFGDDDRHPRPGRFELAQGGSLILEEIGHIPIAQQVKLLRVLEEGELERSGSARTHRVDVRVISVTNADLDASVRADRFRRDLLYRLNAMQIRMPSLRDRSEDIIPLARHFILRECRRRGRGSMFLSVSTERAMRAYEWPGNIRELEHAVERAVLLADGDEIDVDGLNLCKSTASALVLDRLTLPEAEEMIIRSALERNDHNLQRASDALGISRQSLYRRLDKHRARYGFEPIE